MNDQDIERVLRTTLTDRAGTVTDGPAWSRGEDEASTSRTDRPRTRLLAPLAAAAVILAVVGGVFALRHNEKRADSTPVAIDQIPIPAGMKAVDAMGVEIFVPADFTVDTPCSGPRVTRPVAIPVAASCPSALNSTHVEISAIPVPSRPGCSEQLELDGELACLSTTATTSLPSTSTYEAYWTKHRVAVSAVGDDRAVLLRIIRSAHAVPVDRHGCAADRDPIEPPGKRDPADADGAPTVPENRPATSMGVCWYIANRLVAAGTLGADAADSVLRSANEAAKLFSPAGTAACSAVDHTDAVILSVHYARGGAAEGILRLARCPDRNYGVDQATFVSNLGHLSEMPLSLGYPARR
jgi:hypothetical protein